MAKNNIFPEKNLKMCPTEPKMKLVSSASEQNVYFTYVCLINDIKPTERSSAGGKRGPDASSYPITTEEHAELDVEDEPIQVERTKALHELVEAHKNCDNHESDNYSTAYPTTASESSDLSGTEFTGSDNPNILKLTKMKWLTEESQGSPDSSSPCLSPVRSTTSTFSVESDDSITSGNGEKYLSTILRLDREHNLFGLSNIAIVGPRPSKRQREEDGPAFPQTAIVQICCANSCCRHKSKTDLPSSLKCGRKCYPCFVPSCVTCNGSCGPPFVKTCPSACSSICPRGLCTKCPPKRCQVDCTNCYGMKISFNKKPKYEPLPVELTPRSSSVLQKPIAARTCTHTPRCIPPQACFPYLMPCYWPARPSAPCSNPTHCFHNPPCLAPRKRKSKVLPIGACAKTGSCVAGDRKCPNILCPGKIPDMKKAIESRFGSKK